MNFVTVLPWHLPSYWWISSEDPSTGTRARCCWCLPRIHLLLRWSASGRTTAASEGLFVFHPQSEKLCGVVSRKIEIAMILKSSFYGRFSLSVSCSDSMGRQGSMGAHWAWKSLREYWLCGRLCGAPWCWSLSSGLSLSLSLMWRLYWASVGIFPLRFGAETWLVLCFCSTLDDIFCNQFWLASFWLLQHIRRMKRPIL